MRFTSRRERAERTIRMLRFVPDQPSGAIATAPERMEERAHIHHSPEAYEVAELSPDELYRDLGTGD